MDILTVIGDEFEFIPKWSSKYKDKNISWVRWLMSVGRGILGMTVSSEFNPNPPQAEKKNWFEFEEKNVTLSRNRIRGGSQESDDSNLTRYPTLTPSLWIKFGLTTI